MSPEELNRLQVLVSLYQQTDMLMTANRGRVSEAATYFQVKLADDIERFHRECVQECVDANHD